MRIVIDLQPCQNGSRHRGIGRYSMAITRAMIKLGSAHQFVIALNESFPQAIDEVRKELGDLLPQEAFTVFSVPGNTSAADPMNAWRNRAAELARSQFLDSLQPDLVFIPSLMEGLWDDTVVSVERGSRYLTAVTLYDLIPLEDPKRYLGGESDRDAYLRRIGQMCNADLIMPISHYVARDAASKLGLDHQSMTVAHCGVESHFAPAVQCASPQSSLLNDYGITRPYVMTASPFESRKNIEGLIAGFASMSASVRNAHQLVLLGRMDAFARKYLVDLAQDEGLAVDTLVFPGFVPDSDLPSLYHGASVFAFPSFSEGFGLPLLEAMACGTPVVGSNCTSIPEVVGREDLLCDPANAVTIAQAMERILTNPQLQADLRAYGLERAALFTWEKAAAIILDAFQTLHMSTKPVLVAPQSSERAEANVCLRKVAYVLADVPLEHRLAGVDEAIVAALAEQFDLTVIDRRCNADAAPLSTWIQANCAIQDTEWMRNNAERLDHIIYSTDIMADASLRHLISDHPGSLLLTNRLSISKNDLVGSAMFDGAQLSVLNIDGPRGLFEAASAALSTQQIITRLHRDLAERATQVITEDSAALFATEPKIGILTSALSKDAGRAFRTRIGFGETAKIIVAMPANERAAEKVIRVFREATAGKDRTYALLICSDETLTTECSTAVGNSITHLFGDVAVVRGPLDPIYRGILSSAEMVILDSALTARIKMLVAADCPAASAFSFADKGFAGSFTALLCPTDLEPLNDADHRDDPDITGAAKSRLAAIKIQSLVSKCILNTRGDALQTFARSLPAQVRGIIPDSDDVAQLAISLARNEEHCRSAKLYIDITAFEGPRASHRLNLTCRKWLEHLFLQVGPDVRAVYADGDHFVLANHFTARVCGIESPSLQDEAVVPRSGDRVLGLDLFHAFPDAAFEALTAGRRRGMVINYVVLDDLAHDRTEFVPSLINLLLAWSRDTKLRLRTPSVAALPRRMKGRSSAWSPHQHHERVAALVAVGLCPNVLSCDEVMLESFTGAAALADLSPAVLDLYKAWEVQHLRPTTATTRERSSARDFGHVITGHLLGSYSLAIINRALASTLERAYPGQARYLPVETTSINHTEGVPLDEKSLMIELSSRPPLKARDEIVISHHYPILVPEEHYRLSLAVFFWEESHIPRNTIRQLSENFDGIISPARSVTKALIDSGLSIPIATIGQPVNVDRYAALAASRSRDDGQTTFLHVSSSFQRKGIDILLAAWAKAFTSANDVRLVIKTFPNPHNDIEQQVAELQALHTNLATIEIVNRDVDVQEMPQFYAEADVMVLPTRGEGYNLPALEAMASGLPLIVTGFGGHRDFCSEQEARLLRYSFAKTESHVGGANSMWVEPDVEDLVNALREHVEPTNLPAIEARRQRAMLSAMRESNNSAWLHRYDVMIDQLCANTCHEAPRIAWISTWAVQCGIAQYSNYLLENFSDPTRRQVRVICDTRTLPNPQADIAFIPTWEVSNVPKVEQILQSIKETEAEAVIIQHQDGLLSWDQLGSLARDRRLSDKTTIVILHNAGNMMRCGDDERAVMLEGLAEMTRVLVHNIADVNFLLSLGLCDNVGLLPHGASAKSQAPWPRRLSPADAPVIGCHGFFFRHKGIDKLIRAAALLREEWPLLKLRLVNARFPDEGHDAYINECRRLAVSLGIADAIEWHQDFLPIEEIDSLLTGCDVIALPYEESDDSASGAVRVSLASMVPLVATRVKIFAELGDAAEWSDNNDPRVLADTLALLLRSPERRRSIQAAMHEWLLAHDWKEVAGTLEGMIRGLVIQRRTGWNDDLK